MSIVKPVSLLTGGGGFGTTEYSLYDPTSTRLLRPCVDCSGFNISGPRTHEFWWRPITWTSSTQFFMSMDDTSASSKNFAIYARGGSNNYFRAYYYQPGSFSNFTMRQFNWSPPVLGDWYHLAFVTIPGVGASAVMKMYVNLVEITSGGFTATAGGSASNVATAGNFGLLNTSSSRSFYESYIDEARIWRTALDLPTLTANWKRHVNPDDSLLGAYWRFENDSYIDMTSYAQHLSLAQGSPSFSPVVPTW